MTPSVAAIQWLGHRECTFVNWYHLKTVTGGRVSILINLLLGISLMNRKSVCPLLSIVPSRVKLTMGWVQVYVFSERRVYSPNQCVESLQKNQRGKTTSIAWMKWYGIMANDREDLLVYLLPHRPRICSLDIHVIHRSSTRIIRKKQKKEREVGGFERLTGKGRS